MSITNYAKPEIRGPKDDWMIFELGEDRPPRWAEDGWVRYMLTVFRTQTFPGHRLLVTLPRLHMFVRRDGGVLVYIHHELLDV